MYQCGYFIDFYLSYKLDDKQWKNISKNTYCVSCFNINLISLLKYIINNCSSVFCRNQSLITKSSI